MINISRKADISGGEINTTDHFCVCYKSISTAKNLNNSTGVLDPRRQPEGSYKIGSVHPSVCPGVFLELCH